METENKFQNTPFLIIFAFFYTAITLFFIDDLNSNQSGSLRYVFVFPFFWIVAGIILLLSISINKIKIKGSLDVLLLSFSTPIAFIVFLFISYLFSPSSQISSTYEYDKGGLRFREVEYVYSNLKIERKEIYTSRGYGWNKDSIWVYYDKDGKVLKKENYTQN